ncbi:MAG: iron ABC transporter permease [Muribaculaceae bacterium]|nr:iron ABC transporter permease [Muribaculaceae bacterium]
MNTRRPATIATAALSIALLAPACLLAGAVHIPAADVWQALCGGPTEHEAWGVIVRDIRVPMAATAALGGMALSVAGLLMQTLFRNPLAGPSIMGISSGASLGVALVVLAGVGGGAAMSAATLTGALAGSLAIMALLMAISTVVRSAAMLLIVGVLTGYVSSSAISLLNFFAPQQSVHAYMLWGLGNFTSVSAGELPWFATLTASFTLLSMLFIKPLDALLLGERYAENMGVHLGRVRAGIMLAGGTLTAAVTAWCGPIAFIGLAVPHVARLALNTSSHKWLMPAAALIGAATGLLTALLSVLPSQWGVLPVNAITPLLGVPVILYIILNGRKIAYFN